MDKFSYCVGLVMAQNLQKQGLTEVTATDLAKGVEDALAGKKPQVPEEEINKILQEGMQKNAIEKHGANIKAGQDFLEMNKKREGVITLPSGLQYEVINQGLGPKPAATDKVTTHYHGTLIDGRVFDSSVQRGEPATFPVNGVIPGWVEALQLMNTGSKWRLFVPADLAYGERGAGEMIKPFSTLIFEVELLEIN